MACRRHGVWHCPECTNNYNEMMARKGGGGGGTIIGIILVILFFIWLLGGC